MFIDCHAKANIQYSKTSEPAKEDRLQSHFNRYWNDVEFKNSKNEMNKTRSRNKVVSSVCKKSIVCGSMYEHKKRCREHRELTPLEELCLLL